MLGAGAVALAGVFRNLADDLAALAAPLFARAGGPRRRVAVAEGDALALYEIAPDGAARKLTPPVAGASGALTLPPGATLRRELSFPGATRPYLDAVLDARLDRLVPWAPERVVYAYRQEDAADGALKVEVVAAARETVELWSARAEAAGFTPTGIGPGGADPAAPLALDLWRGRRDPAQARARRMVAGAAAASALVLLPLAGWSFVALGAVEARAADLAA
ncbi:hypothetical protein ACFSCV_05550, partial [Methylopila henanensis]